MQFYIFEAKLGGINMADGDEIAIFDGEDSVGATVVGTYEIDLVIASKDDGTGCGFTEGNPVIVRVWDASEGLMYLVVDDELTFYDTADASPIDPVSFEGQASVGIGFNVVPISVELSSFNADLIDERHVSIQWSTKSEIKTAGFYVQRSDKEKSGIKRIHDQLFLAQRNSIAGADYQMIDSDVPGGCCYYRLEEVTLDGHSHYFNPVQVATATGVKGESGQSFDFVLQQNYPNPFNPTTQISYTIPQSSFVKLNIFDLNGYLVKQLVNQQKEAGRYTVVWDATAQNGSQVASGTYLCRLQVGTKILTRKLLFMK